MTIPQNQIILRLDDAGAWHYDELVQRIADDVTSRNLHLVIAVIPKDISKDTNFLLYMRELLRDPRIEVAQHGYEHSEEEFRDYTYEEAIDAIEKGKEEIIRELKVVPITFIPPYNVYSKATEDALKAEGFKVIAGEEGEYSIKPNMLILGYTATTSDFPYTKDIDVSRIIADCRQSLAEKGYCEIMIHPQDFLTDPDLEGPREFDMIKYTQFQILLDSLKKVNAESITFKDNLYLNI